MSLSYDLISQFAKITNDSKKIKKEITTYGTIVKYNNANYVKMDGSDLLTPYSSTVALKDGDRVVVSVKNHTATVTGSTSNPSASNNDLQETNSKVSKFNKIVADKITADQLEVINGYFEQILAISGKYEDLQSVTAEIETLRATYARMENINASDVEAINAEIESIKSKFLESTTITTEDLNAANAQLTNITAYNANFTYVSAEKLKAINANITNLNVNVFDAESGHVKFLNVDFSNIDIAWIGQFFSESGVIQNVQTEQGYVSGQLYGVTINGDMIIGNSIQADKLVIKGNDGIYYKLNIDGLNNISTSQASKFVLLEIEPEDWETNYADYYIINNNEYIHITGDTAPTFNVNTYYKLSSIHGTGLDGTNILAQTITADKITVSDLVAFGATIGGFHISNHSIYSGVKTSVLNNTRGIYMDDNGQIAIGDSNNYFKYFYDETDNKWKLLINADKINIGGSSKSISEIIEEVREDAVIEAADYINSKAEQLIINGTGILGNNTNFSGFEFDGANAYNCPGSFKRKTKGYPVTTDDFFAVNPDKSYKVTTYMKSTLGTMSFYDMLVFYDADKRVITASNHMYISGSTTELAEDLKDGDTIVKLVSTAGFNNTYDQTYRNGLIFWNYKNSFGYQYPSETFSRNVYQNLYTKNDINKTNNTITLKTAWNNGTIPAGTKVSQTNDGGTYKYIHGNNLVPIEWTKFEGIVGGIDYTGTNASGKFPPGTAYAKIGWLWNYNNVDDYAWVCNVSVTENLSSKDAIINVDIEYYLSTSSSSPTGGSWSTTAPTWVDGKYMWLRQKITYGNNNTQYKNQTCIAGAKGSTGTSVDSITEEYYLSTSKTTQTGGSWVTTPPNWSSGKYIWTRSKIVYKNPASTAYTEPICSSEWEAVNDINIGGRNLAKNPLNFDRKSNNITFSDNLITFSEINQDTYFNIVLHASLEAEQEYTLSWECEGLPDDYQGLAFPLFAQSNPINKTLLLKNGKQKVIFSLPSDSIYVGTDYIFMDDNGTRPSTTNITIKNIKLEKGNKDTDWTPAPEDIDSNIQNVEDKFSGETGAINKKIEDKEEEITGALADKISQEQLNAAINAIETEYKLAELDIDKINGVITALASGDSEGRYSIIQQSGDGFVFGMGDVIEAIKKAESSITTLEEIDFDKIQEDIGEWNTAHTYIRLSEVVNDEGNKVPIIILGATDSLFQVRITNTAIDFMERTNETDSETGEYIYNRIAYANNNTFFNETTVVKESIKIANSDVGFVWKTRPNGNLGLMWVEE